MFTTSENLENFMNSFYSITHTPMFLLNEQKMIVYQCDAFPQTKKDVFLNIINKDIHDRLFYLGITKCELFLIFPFPFLDSLHYFVMGPILYYQKHHSTSLQGFDFLKYGDFQDPHHILSLLPSPTEAFFSYIELLYGLLHNQRISQEELKKKFEYTKIMHEKDYFYNSIIQQREDFNYNYTYQDEQRLLHHIQQGDTSEAVLICSKISRGRIGNMSQDQLRKSKYALVASISIITRAVVEVGVPIHQAYSLSDTYIIKVDEEYDSRHLFNLFLDLAQDYCILVKKYKNRKYPVWLRTCLEYIDLHLHENITLSDLCQHVHMNDAYLSVQFKKLRGESIKEYVNKQRIHEAKHLLLSSDLSIQEISTRLCFYDQSYFTKIFKRYSSMLPNTYRMQRRK